MKTSHDSCDFEVSEALCGISAWFYFAVATILVLCP